jgi:hypothetical protein
MTSSWANCQVIAREKGRPYHVVLALSCGHKTERRANGCVGRTKVGEDFLCTECANRLKAGGAA